jgi:hypothetical protein
VLGKAQMTIARVCSIGIAVMILAAAPARTVYAAHQYYMALQGKTQGKFVGGSTRKNPRPVTKIITTKVSK